MNVASSCTEPMKKCLASALLALGLILDVQAQRVPNPDPTTTVRAVLDNGSTAVLLGVGLGALALAHRRRRVAAP